MDNEPLPPTNPTPPPPDIPSAPPPSAGPPPPSFTPPPPAPPPPPGMMSSIEPEPKPKPSIKKDAEEEEGVLPPAGSEAPLNQRLIAAFVDYLVAGMCLVFLSYVPVIKWFAWPIYLGYLLTRDALPFLGGQSVGKKAMKLRAVTADGKSLSGNWEASLIRNISVAIGPLGLVEAFILWQKSQQPGTRLLRLGDEWAKTKVIVAQDETPPSA